MFFYPYHYYYYFFFPLLLLAKTSRYRYTLALIDHRSHHTSGISLDEITLSRARQRERASCEPTSESLKKGSMEFGT